jgi:uncharacterized protein
MKKLLVVFMRVLLKSALNRTFAKFFRINTMWEYISSKILRFRVLLLIVVGLITLFMGYHASKVEMSYDHAQLLPKKDSAFLDYKQFLSTFGEEGNIIVIGIQHDQFFDSTEFVQWQELCNQLNEIEGVENMLSVHNSFQLVKNTEERKFDLKRIFPDEIESQRQLDSLKTIFNNIPLYSGYLHNDSTNAYLAVLTMNKDKMKTRERESTIMSIRAICSTFENQTEHTIHYSGLPYIRVMNTILVKREIYLFTGLALLVVILILFLFFRSFRAMFFSALIVLIGVVWALGTTSLLGFHITILTGMIPPLLIVIGIPNSIYMLNKYHNEYRLHRNKIKALKRVIMKIGSSIFLTNLTTAIGFATFITTSSDILKEFGIVAASNIIGLFVLSIILIPSIFSFMPPPEEKHIRHLDRKGIGKIIEKLIHVTLYYRKWVYATTIIIVGLSVFGITLMKSTGFMVDDLPKDDPIYSDLHFFESNFDGLMPLEIIIDTKTRNGILQAETLRRMEELDDKLKSYDELSSSLSIVNVIKLAKQSFYNGNPAYYALPSNTERNFILSYATKATGDLSMAHSFIDSTKQISRISIRMKDVGTKRMDELYHQFLNDVQEIFPKERYDVTVTGSSVIFFRGNQYLIHNLFGSLALAIVLISLIMAAMFRSARMVTMSLIPNIIPLLFTAALMGFTSIPIKASTILVFSIAFGISVDNSIHFLAKYRQELNVTNWNIRKSIILALRETGVSMIYTCIVLFSGFGIFAISSFGGTKAMGVLVSLTLLVAVISNLVLLPSLLIGFEQIITKRSFKEPLLQIYNEEIDIDLDELEIENNTKETNS